MITEKAQLLTGYLAPRADDCCSAILSALPPEYAEQARLLVREWFERLVDGLEGRPDRANEMAVILSEMVRSTGKGFDTAIELLQHARRILISMCLSKIPGLPDSDLYEMALEFEARYTHYVAEYFSQVERETLASERRRQRAMAEAMAHPFAVLDNNGIITLANMALAHELGKALESLTGQELAIYFDDGTAGELRRVLRQRRSTKSIEFRGHLLAPKGRFLPFNITVQPMFDAQGLRDGVAVALQMPKTKLQSGTDYLNAVVENIMNLVPLGLQVFDRNRRVIFTNDHLINLCENEAAKHQPVCCRMRFPGLDSRWSCACEQVFDSDTVVQREAILEDAGAPRWFQMLLVPMTGSDDETENVACIMRDVTPLRTLENEILGRQQTSLASQVAVTVAHQLRNPLGVLIGFADLLARGLPPEQVPGAVDKMLRNSIRCKEIVENLLEFGRGFPGERVPTELSQLVHDTVQPMFTRSQNKRIEWRLPETAGPVECIPNQLAQVFMSLLDNALRAAREQVIFEIAQEKRQVSIWVRDDGPGIPEEIQSSIFQPFFTTRKSEGAVGLGLSLSQTVINEYGGQLFLDKTGQGASFHIELPLTHEPAEPSPEQEIETLEPPEERRLLVVDDEADLLEMLAMVLEMRGFTVDTTGTGAEAIELIQKHTYDAVVLDVRLPGDLSGPQLFDFLAATHPALAKRIMFITADTMNFETRKFLERVKRPSMEKPFLVQEFAEKVMQLFEAPP